MGRKAGGGKGLDVLLLGACWPYVHPPAVLLDPVVSLMFDICKESGWRLLLKASSDCKTARTSADDQYVVEPKRICLRQRHDGLRLAID